MSSTELLLVVTFTALLGGIGIVFFIYQSELSQCDDVTRRF
jgi:hypothetical protein